MNPLKPVIPYPVKVLSVEALTKHIKSIVEGDKLLAGVWVQGEISNLVKAASGMTDNYATECFERIFGV